MTWADMEKVTGNKPPELPLQTLREARFAVDYGPFLYGSAHPFTAPALPVDVSSVPEDPSKWPVDRVEQVFIDNEEVKSIVGANLSNDLALFMIKDTLDKLEAKAADSSNSRKLRKLKIP